MTNEECAGIATTRRRNQKFGKRSLWLESAVPKEPSKGKNRTFEGNGYENYQKKRLRIDR